MYIGSGGGKRKRKNVLDVHPQWRVSSPSANARPAHLWQHSTTHSTAVLCGAKKKKNKSFGNFLGPNFKSLQRTSSFFPSALIHCNSSGLPIHLIAVADFFRCLAMAPLDLVSCPTWWSLYWYWVSVMIICLSTQITERQGTAMYYPWPCSLVSQME